MLKNGSLSLSSALFDRFSSNFAWELIFGRSVLGLQMGKFCQTTTELWPLIDVAFSQYLCQYLLNKICQMDLF